MSALGTFAGARYVTDTNYILGDANSDREVNAKDSLAVISYFMEIDTSPVSDAADIEADGIINARDSFYIKAYCAGKLNLTSLENNPVSRANIAGVPIYEGGDREYNFETLKAYLAARVMWNPRMSYEEYTDAMKEYLRINYGDGYEYIYRYILMDNESGNAVGCFRNNHDRPFDMHSKDYLNEHYEEMHTLLKTALDMCVTEAQRERLTLLYYCAEFMGLSASYERMYTGGDSASRALYEERYTEMWNYMYERSLKIFHTPDLYSVPEEIDFTVSPMVQFYGFGAWNDYMK